MLSFFKEQVTYFLHYHPVKPIFLFNRDFVENKQRKLNWGLTYFFSIIFQILSAAFPSHLGGTLN